MLFNVIGYDNQVMGQVEADNAIEAWSEAGKKYENVLDIKEVEVINIEQEEFFIQPGTNMKRFYFEIDPGLRDIIKRLNYAGYITTDSCSGLHADHPIPFLNRLWPQYAQGYISFSAEYNSEEKLIGIKNTARMSNLEVQENWWGVIIRTTMLKSGVGMCQLTKDIEREWVGKPGQTIRARELTLLKEHGGYLLDTDEKIREAWNKFVDILVQGIKY